MVCGSFSTVMTIGPNIHYSLLTIAFSPRLVPPCSSAEALVQTPKASATRGRWPEDIHHSPLPIHPFDVGLRKIFEDEIQHPGNCYAPEGITRSPG